MDSREHQAFKGMKEKSVTLRANRIKKSLDYSKVENPLFVNQQYDLKQNENSLRNMGDKDDAPVKNMRNLPGYLQRVEKGENVQEKALNFGVLDWGRLENWKSNEKRIPPRYNMKKTSHSINNPTLLETGSSRFSRTRKKIHPPMDQQASNLRQITKSCVERLPPGVRWPKGNALKPQISKISEINHPSSPVDLHLSESRNTSDDNLIEANCFSPEGFLSISPFSKVPHSCPLAIPEPESPSETPITPLTDRFLQENTKFDLGIDEQPVSKGRFSFNLGKMTKSLSFKETSSLPQLSSTYTSVKSGPVDSETHNNWKNGNASTPSRSSSPLRRLIDPFLKLKSPQKPKMNRNSTSFDINVKQKLSNNVQALLQLTLKNGIPFFKLVVESSSDILAAAVKKLPSGKDDSSLTYAFYSVHETKKKNGGWIYQREKEKKNLPFGYNIVAQMKISSSYHAEFSDTEKDLYVVRESVLYGTDCGLERELAAIIVKNPSDETCGDIGSSKSMVVIVPDGVHGLPDCGLPSPLINRWRSGGVCDCGGWDIGCRFRVMNRQNETVKDLNSSSNHLDLCYQGGREKKCGFSLAPLQDGLYSLEYGPSISLLQAFSISVAVVSSQKLTHIFQVNYVNESKDLLSNPITTRDEKLKSPAKYVSKPPTSPFGRV